MDRARARGGADSRCPACRAPVFRQKANDAIPFNVAVDTDPLTTKQQAELREPNRLVYCLVRPQLGTPRLRLIGAWHPSDCEHAHVIEHRCPPAEPTTLF